MAAPVAPLIQVFGTDDSQSTRAAARFFKERRLAIQSIDLRRKPMAPGELRRFVERLGARALADTEGRAWQDAGFGYLRMDDAELVERLLADQRLLRLPLVRIGDGVAAGRDEATWKTLLAAATAAAAAAGAASATGGGSKRTAGAPGGSGGRGPVGRAAEKTR